MPSWKSPLTVFSLILTRTLGETRLSKEFTDLRLEDAIRLRTRDPDSLKPTFPRRTADDKSRCADHSDFSSIRGILCQGGVVALSVNASRERRYVEFHLLRIP